MRSGADPRPGGRAPPPRPPALPTELVARPVQLQGSALARRVARLAGWQVDFDGLPGRQGVLIVYPHTSNWDFVVGLLAKWSIGLPLTFWGKDTLFRLPLLGRWLRWLGGVPVDRHAARGAVGQMVQRLVAARDRGDMLWLALAPEGTRGYRESWRSGFYQLALQAQVPLGLAYLDYGRKRVGVHSFLQLSGQVEHDMAEIARRLRDRTGRRPAQAAPIRLE